MDYNQAMDVLQKSMDDMMNMGDMIGEPVTVVDNTQFIGDQSPLDSIALVSFIVALEQRTNKRIVVSKIHQFNMDDAVHKFDPYHPVLYADTLARYVMTL